MPDLELLDLSDNSISDVPDTIKELKKLEVLSLFESNIQEDSPMAQDLKKLKKLRWLYFDKRRW